MWEKPCGTRYKLLIGHVNTNVLKNYPCIGEIIFDVKPRFWTFSTPPEPQNIGQTQCLATFLPFRAPGSDLFLL